MGVSGRRAVVWLVSAGFGAACVLAALRLFETTLVKFALSKAVLIFLSMGALAFSWLDFVIRTKCLRS
jgi:hypothetical protein